MLDNKRRINIMTRYYVDTMSGLIYKTKNGLIQCFLYSIDGNESPSAKEGNNVKGPYLGSPKFRPISTLAVKSFIGHGYKTLYFRINKLTDKQTT